MSDQTDEKLKSTLESFWTVCPEPGQGKEYDHLIDGIASDEQGASRLVGSGESQTGSEVRIRFKSKG
jgi:hypothetical protein